MRRFAIAALALTLPVVFAACENGNNSVEPTTSVSGTYFLRTVNGSPLPYTFSDGSTLVSDVLTLYSDGTYTDNGQFADGFGSGEQGYYDALNGSITFAPQGSTSYSGSLSGSVLTEIFTGLTEVYQKQ
ncbi:MAG TPA: hypothetical protein VHV78_12055 [Gemmatimonadaceae bacterium]|nr:hypothetical protein [Gemmatimonadaceae bacterium]